MTVLRLTVTCEYKADPMHYGGTEDPKEMARMDEQSEDLIHLIADLGPYSLTVEPVED